MLAFLVLLSLHHAWAHDIPRDTNYVTKQNVTCPASGFIFQREVDPNSSSSTCYLCFCKNNGTAICWKRQTKRCDLAHYHDFGKRNLRARRSPLSLGEVFVRDAARDFFNKQSPEQCKPFESSFSDGCPPADWCIGCTVCDCDANGRWDCHVLSFCPDKHGKKQMKKRRGHPRNHMGKRQLKTSTSNASGPTRNTTKPPKKPTRKRSIRPTKRSNQVKQSSSINKLKINQVKATKVNKIVTVRKPLTKLQAKKAISNRNKAARRPLIIKKNVTTSKTLHSKSGNDKRAKNNTVEVAQKVVKQFMTTMQKMIQNIDRNTNHTSRQVNNVLKKRSMTKQDNNKKKKDAKPKLKFVTKPMSNTRKSFSKTMTSKPHNSNTNKYSRLKRQVISIASSPRVNDSNYSDKSNTVNKTDQVTSMAVLSLTHESNNKAENITHTNKEIYITDNNIYTVNEQTTLKDGMLYKSFNNTKSTVHWNYTFQQNTSKNNVADVLILTTDSSYLLINVKQFNTTRNEETPNIRKENKDFENEIFENDKNISNVYTHTENQNKDHNCTYRTLLHKLIVTNTERYNNTPMSFEASKKPKRYTILTKIRRLFKKIFNKSNKYTDLYNKDFDIKQSDYKKSKHCKFYSKEKEKLRQSINELKTESENILKTIGIIKGLLHILEVNTNETRHKISSKSYDVNEKINKLKMIVKSSYEKENGTKLTEDQRTQISYIKDNVQVFIKSIGKFVKILNDVIQIAMNNNRRRENKFIGTKMLNYNNSINNVIRDDSYITKTKLEKLKKFIFNYNLLQNKFIDKIYVILNNLEANNTDRYNLKPIVYRERYRQINKTDAIETNSANIIKNIRKLKLMAEKINASKRRKRETGDDDDALEYLLLLMEYLLKRQAPTRPSDNDGIDLLIEAIKSAPDIKLNRKKVLNSITEKTLVTRTFIPISSFRKRANYSALNTVEEQNNFLSEIPESKIKTTSGSHTSEDDDDDDDDKIEEFYRNFKYNKDLRSEQKQDDISFAQSNTSLNTESYYNIKEVTTPKSYNIEHRILRYKTTDDFIEDEITTNTPKTLAIQFGETTTNSVTEYSTIVNGKFKNQITTNSDNFLIDSKANIDWIEENFKEIKEFPAVEIKSTTPKSLSATRTHKYTENISDITNENNTYSKKEVNNTSAEEIISKKQLDLLNSLDYIEDDVDSKDDTFSSDTYV